MLTHNQLFLSEYVRTPQMSKIDAYVLSVPYNSVSELANALIV